MNDHTPIKDTQVSTDSLGSPLLPSGLLVIGLDGEMSASDLEAGGRLIQGGIAVFDDGGVQVTSELMSWPDMRWDPRAAEVHQLPRDVVDAAQTVEEADEVLYSWLLARGAVAHRRTLITVGFNVGAFDHPFFRHALPRAMSVISRRTIDLNAVCMTLDGWDPSPRCTTPRDWSGWKRSAKNAAKSYLDAAGVEGVEHDAGYDAALAIVAWLWLRAQIRSARAAC